MEDGGPSITARRVAAHRLGFTRIPAPYGDPAADDVLATDVASGGMIPKLETAVAAVEAGVESAVILDGRRPHAMLVELFTEHGAGTLVRA